MKRPRGNSSQQTMNKKQKVSISHRIAKVEKELKRERPETKTNDNLLIGLTGAQLIPNTGLSYLCQEIAEGTDYNQRVGLGVHMSSIDFKCQLVTGVTSATFYSANIDMPNYCQFHLVKDLQTVENSTTLNLSDIWVDTTQFPSTFRRVQSHSRYKILASSRIYNLNRMVDKPASGTSFLIPTEDGHVHLRHKFKYPLKTEYNSSSSTAIQKNGVYLVALSNYAAGTSNSNGQPFFQQANIRVNYIDE